MITTVVRRVLPLAAVIGILVAFMRQQQVPPANADLWFHLRFGQEFLDGWSLRAPGNLSPFDTAHWTPTQWLPQVAMAWAADRWGLDSVIWATGVVILLLVVRLFASCRRVAAPLPAAIAVVLGTLAASPGLSARPQVLSYLFVVIIVAAWFATWEDGRVRYRLVLLSWLWPMCHGMWPVGISISAAAVVGLTLERRFSRAHLLRLASIPVVSAAVAFLTPIWFDTYRSLFAVGSRSAYFKEWGAPDFTSMPAAALGVMIVLVAAGGMRARPVPWMHVTLTVLAVAWSLYSLRTTVVGALILTPLLAIALARLVPAGNPPARREKLVLAAMVVAACVALWPVVKAHPVKDVVPTWVDARLDAMAPGSRLLNDWDSGSWFLYRHPDLSVVMHGYGDVFTEAEIERNFDLAGLEPGWDDDLAGLDADAALLDPDSPLGYALARVLGWDVEQSDDDFVLLLPPQN